MINTIKKFLLMLTTKERRKFYFLFFAMIIMGVTEITGIGSIAPFLSVISDPSAVENSEILSYIYNFFHFTSINTFIIAMGFSVLGFVLLRNITAILVKYIEIRFAEMQGFRISKRLMTKYLSQPYVFFLNKNSSEISRNILAEVNNLIRTFLIPLLELLTTFITVLAIIIFLVIMDPKVALIIASLLLVLYGGIYLAVKKVLFELGIKRLDANNDRFKVVHEAFGGVKDVKLMGKESVFLSYYGKIARKIAIYQSNKRIIGAFPRYALDSIVFGAMISTVLYMLFNSEEGMGDSLSLFGLYGLAAYRMMPALNKIFKFIANLKGSQAVVDVIYEELGNVTDDKPKVSKSKEPVKKLQFQKDIVLEDILFSYPDNGSPDKSPEPVINNQSLVIPKNTTIGFAGPTGCGKTTIVDIILGLLIPEKGTLSVDGKVITKSNLREWQANLGYVPQNIFLSDDTITGNIAFGVPAKEIDHEQVKRVSKIANLDEFITKELPNGYDSSVGEQGVRLSGGQIQRIGIARALYHDPDVLVLDEATSALDGITESIIMEAIKELAGKKTIILIAHRLSTLRDADTIFLMEKGRITARGSYDSLLSTNSTFKYMATIGKEN